ncbi:fungal-specific transcription factor domain-containing protein [Pyrenochaeta sp. MPI-SDFR-AT-0127]|nr:fungal-specific transcription factor domain-containing protein [Pyrenochaeta sp. MPI-SDFR-AT-0127]
MSGVEDSTSQDPVTKSPTKRKRVAHACDACRQRKSRCDGLHPTCALCVQQGIQCHYRDTVNSYAIGPDQQYLARLEGRLKDMESILQTLVPSRAHGFLNSPPVSTRNEAENETDADLWRFETSDQSVNINSMLPGRAPLEMTFNTKGVDRNISRDSVDGMGSITFANEADSGSFGPTSNTAFLQQIVSTQNVCLGPKKNIPSDLLDFNAAASFGFSRPASPPNRPPSRQILTVNQLRLDSCGLPPQQEILGLIDVFFENTGRFFPYLYKPHLLSNLAAMRSNRFQGIERSQICVLYLVLAFATSHCPSGTPALIQQERGDVYLRMALALIPDIKPTLNNLESMQALLLATQYVQGTQRSSQTWEMLGRLVNASFHVGLFQHTAGTGCNPLDAELRKRIWWTCLIMDRMCSMTYGRPPLIPNMYMTVGLPADAELDTLVTNQSNHVEPRSAPTSSLLLYTSKLYVILGSVIEKVYENNISNNANITPFLRVLSKVLDVEQNLSTWVHELPPSLLPITALELEPLLGYDESTAFRFRLILTLRYLNVRMLLHRSVLFRLLEARTAISTALDQGFMLKASYGSIETCVNTAVETLAIISQTTQRQHIIPIWWYSIYFTFSSALVVYGTILGVQKCEFQCHRYSLPDLVGSLQTAFDILGRLGGDTRQVVRCQIIVKHLLKAATALCNQPKGPERETDSSAFEEPNLGRADIGTLARESAMALANGDLVTEFDPNFPMDLYSFADDINVLLSNGLVM